MRRVFAVIAGAILVLPIGTANAADGYRYWSLWLPADGAWEMAGTGAASVTADPGSVYGWRFVTSGLNPSSDLQPRIPAEFTCRDSATEVGIVLDFGEATDYDGETPPEPRLVCARVNPGDSVMIATAVAVSIRENAGFVCGLAGWPAEGCGEAVAAQSPETGSPAPVESESEDRLDTIAGIVTTILAVVMFAVAWQRMQWQKARQRKAAGEEDDAEPAE